MAAEDLVRTALRMPGRMCSAPTQNGLLSAFPHGGTALGEVAGVALAHEDQVIPVHSWSYGQRMPRGYRHADLWTLSFALRGILDADARAAFFRTSSTSAGGFQGAKTILAGSPGKVDALSPILFSPLDPAHQAVYLAAPLLLPAETKRIALALQEAALFGVTLAAAMNETLGESILIGRLEDLVIS